MNKICGIYCIENIINNKKYIGQSINIKSRWNNHKSELNRNVHHNIYLQNSWNKYGKENFKFYIIKECSIEELDYFEMFYISQYNTCDINYGYNNELGGNTSKIVSDSTRKKQSNSKNELYKNENYLQLMRKNVWGDFYPFYQIDFNGNIVKKWECPISDVEKISNGKFKAANIYSCLGNGRAKSHGGYIWIYCDKYDDFDIEDYIKCNINNGYTVYQYDFNGELIHTWRSTIEASRNGYNRGGINGCCSGKYVQYKGFFWSHKRLNKNEIDVRLSKVSTNRITMYTPDKKVV